MFPDGSLCFSFTALMFSSIEIYQGIHILISKKFLACPFIEWFRSVSVKYDLWLAMHIFATEILYFGINSLEASFPRFIKEICFNHALFLYLAKFVSKNLHSCNFRCSQFSLLLWLQLFVHLKCFLILMMKSMKFK